MKFHYLRFIAKASLLLVLLPIGAVSAEVIDINNEELKQLITEGTTLIDIRTPDEWQSLGVVEDSHPITFFNASGGHDAANWLKQVSALASQDQAIGLICLQGSRSKVVANWLSEQVGYTKVYNVSRGIDHWIKGDNKTVSLP